MAAMVVNSLRSVIFSGTNGRSLALHLSPSALAAVRNLRGRQPETDIWRTTSARRGLRRIVDSTFIERRVAYSNYYCDYVERNYGIAMGLGLYGVEHRLRHMILSTLDRNFYDIGMENWDWHLQRGSAYIRRW